MISLGLVIILFGNTLILEDARMKSETENTALKTQLKTQQELHKIQLQINQKQLEQTLKELRQLREIENKKRQLKENTIISRGESKVSINLSNNDKILLAKMINGEAGDEPYSGKIAVGVVILNRLAYGGYGKTLRQVCYAGNGSQFNCVREKWFGRYDDDDIKAVEDSILAFNQGKYPRNLLYFTNVKTAGDTKFVRSVILKNKYIKIGGHTFALRK